MKSKLIFTGANSIIILLIIIILQCCNTSQKKMANGNIWQVLMPESKDSETDEEGILISDSIIESTSGSQLYKINWVDNNTFNLIDNGIKYKVVLKSSSENTLQAAFLYEAEISPKTIEDWSKLEKDSRLMTLGTKGKKSSNSSNSYLINLGGKDISIPVDSIPPAGDYCYYNNDGNIFQMIRITIESGVVTFKGGENRDKLLECKLESYNQSSEFMDYEGKSNKLPTFRLASDDGYYDFQYLKDGSLSVLFSGFRPATEEQVPDIFVREQSQKKLSNKQYFEDLLTLAATYKLVFGEGEKIGRIVKMDVQPQPPFSGRGVTPFNVPQGKMWTPLFYSTTKAAIGRGFDIIIYTESSGQGSYSVSSGYKFKVGKGNFVSCKYSKQNFKAITGSEQQAVAIFCWRNEPFSLFFLEEDIN